MERINYNYFDVPEQYRAAVQSIVEACQREGLICTPFEAYNAWNEYSDSYAAGVAWDTISLQKR